MKKLILFECSVHGEIKYLNYDVLKDRWKYFYLIKGETAFRRDIPENKKKAIKKAYPEDIIIYSALYEKLPELLIEFSGEHIIITNKDLEFSFDKYLLVLSAEKRVKKKKEYGHTFEGDYKDCFGTLVGIGYSITPNLNHPFIRLVNKNIDEFKGKDKKEHEFFIDELLEAHSFKKIRRIQKHLLDFYVEKGILTKEEAERYILTEKDFCPYDMGEDFLK